MRLYATYRGPRRDRIGITGNEAGAAFAGSFVGLVPGGASLGTGGVPADDPRSRELPHERRHV